MELIVSVTKSPAMAKSSSDTRTNTLVNQEQDNTVKEKSGSSNSLQPYNNIENNMKVIDKKDSNNMAIIELPTAVQSDESQITLGAIESPNKSLHNILTHRLEEKTKVLVP